MPNSGAKRLKKCPFQEAKFPVKNLVKQRCAEGFNSGFKGLMYEIQLSQIILMMAQ
jgi:hypothetical protein